MCYKRKPQGWYIQYCLAFEELKLKSTSMKSIFTGIFIISSMYLLFVHQFHNSVAAPGGASTVEVHRARSRPFARLPPKTQYSRVKPEIINDFIVDDDDLFELSKRQASDDYGHLRFGKRGEELFDDYGHMRFGRSGSDN